MIEKGGNIFKEKDSRNRKLQLEKKICVMYAGINNYRKGFQVKQQLFCCVILTPGASFLFGTFGNLHAMKMTRDGKKKFSSSYELFRFTKETETMPQK
jgi:hypothetical protein